MIDEVFDLADIHHVPKCLNSVLNEQNVLCFAQGGESWKGFRQSVSAKKWLLWQQ